MSVIHSLTSETFEDCIQKHPLVFLDFWAHWCAPCLAFAKVYEEVAAKYPDIFFAKLNIEESPALPDSLEIRSIPHLLIIKNGIVIYSESGSMPASRLAELVEQALAVEVDKGV